MNGKGQISIVIITYNRAADMLELAQNITMLQGLELLKEVIIVNNQSPESYSEVEDFIRQHPEVPFRYSVAPENLGVSRGRNFALRQASAPLLVFIDDDALFLNPDALVQIAAVFQKPGNESVGITAFKVYYHSTNQLQVNAFPHKNFDQKKELHGFDTYYFSGCAHAIRRTVFEQAGYYPENFFYGMEEYDLSYRALRAGFRIIYDDSVAILHKESPLGRISSKDKLRGMWVNKTRVAWKYLPKKFFYSTALLWSIEYFKKAGPDVKGWWQGWKQIRRIPSTEHRNLLSRQVLSQLKKVEARLWY